MIHSVYRSVASVCRNRAIATVLASSNISSPILLRFKGIMSETANALHSAESGKRVEELTWDNRSIRELPIDPVKENYVRSVPNAVFSIVDPLPVENPVLIAASEPALAEIELNAEEIKRPDFAELFSGNKPIPGARPAAHCYCGHQFGSFAGQLGDGATMYLGEIVRSDGRRVEIQFKGAGKTPYSRSADGRKVLRSSVREFLCSELMAALGIPTTRAGTLVTSDTKVERDVFYTGDIIQERATIITRLAETFFRFGSFEIFKPVDPETGQRGPSVGNVELLGQMMDYVLHNFYPEILARNTDKQTRYLTMLEEITRRSARLVACWDAYGWCHGVLNTDNMSIVGVTIDYGPFGWMDRFDPEFICNASDTGGRYSYENQWQAVKWNCFKLGEAFAPALGDKKWRRIGTVYDKEYQHALYTLFRMKLGFVDKEETVRDLPAAAVATSAPPVCTLAGVDAIHTAETAVRNENIRKLVDDLLAVMASTGCDFTNAFRALMDVTDNAPDKADTSTTDAVLENLLAQCASVDEMVQATKPRVPFAQVQMLMQLAQTHPHLAAQMDDIQAEYDRHIKHRELSKRKDSEKRETDRAAWTTWLQSYRGLLREHFSSIAVSETELQEWRQKRLTAMRFANPKYILRNWVAHEAIKAAEGGDFTGVQHLLRRLLDPYGLHDLAAESSNDTAAKNLNAALATSHVAAPDTAVDGDTRGLPGDAKYACRPPPWATGLKVTCSS